MKRKLAKSEQIRRKREARKRFRERVRKVEQSGLIPQRSYFESYTKVTYPKKQEDFSCKKATKNKLLNMVTG